MNDTFVSRLEEEAKDLTQRYNKLCQFFGTQAFLDLSAAHTHLLRIQAEQMRNLHGTLIVRISLLKAEALSK